MEVSNCILFLCLISCGSTAIPSLSSNYLNSEFEEGKTKCEYYNATCFMDPGNPGNTNCQGIETCPDKSHVCYTVWINTNSNLTKHPSGSDVKLMGCWEENHDCSKTDECIEDKPHPVRHFCCCTGHLCNAKFKWDPDDPITTPKGEDTTKEFKSSSSNTGQIWLIILCTAFLILIILGLLCYHYIKKRRASAFDPLPTSDRESGLPLSGGQFGIPIRLQLPQDIALNEVIGKGKSGCVRKGLLNEEIIAVKIFLPQSKQSWTLEKDIYACCGMTEHDNILKFLGEAERKDNMGSEYWLGTQYHANGSLYDFLKANLVSWDDLCKIALSIGKGLAFLHDEKGDCNSPDFKPAIAHRDFKSKNVLIKDDLTACISDFGLAMVLEPGFSNANSQVAQVGTTRYMAPEVLECHITFEKNSFARVDMYACGLVLWELASRCVINHTQHDQNIINDDGGVIAVEEYKLPYEAEISHNPSIEQMLKLVVDEKIRPQMKTGCHSWRINSLHGRSPMYELCDTIEDLWEREEGARISAACLVERVRGLQHRTFVSGMERDLNALNNPVPPPGIVPPPDSGVGSAASSNNGNSISDVESQELLEVSRGQSSTETAPLVNLNFDPNP